MEEMGMSCKLTPKFNFVYKAKLDNNLYEHEFDHVFFGFSDTLPILNKNEVDSFSYKSLDFISKDMLSNPNNYTEWFKICYNEVLKNISNR